TKIANEGPPVKGVDAPTKDTPSPFKVTFDLSIVRAGEPLWARVRRSRDGREWLAPVFSQGGAPTLYRTIGGDGGDAEPPPGTALGAIHAELRRLWESGGVNRLTLMAAGFGEGVRCPHKPGAQQESPEDLAVRIRRMLNRRSQVPREARRAWS